MKATLGPNALIEGTRRVTNGRNGALAQQYVEVTAAPPQGLKWPFASREARPLDLPLRGSILVSKDTFWPSLSEFMPDRSTAEI